MKSHSISYQHSQTLDNVHHFQWVNQLHLKSCTHYFTDTPNISSKTELQFLMNKAKHYIKHTHLLKFYEFRSNKINKRVDKVISEHFEIIKQRRFVFVNGCILHRHTVVLIWVEFSRCLFYEIVIAFTSSEYVYINSVLMLCWKLVFKRCPNSAAAAAAAQFHVYA